VPGPGRRRSICTHVPSPRQPSRSSLSRRISRTEPAQASSAPRVPLCCGGGGAAIFSRRAAPRRTAPHRSELRGSPSAALPRAAQPEIDNEPALDRFFEPRKQQHPRDSVAGSLRFQQQLSTSRIGSVAIAPAAAAAHNIRPEAVQ